MIQAETGDAIRDVTLQARKLLMEEISEQLEGIYGLLPDGKFRPRDQYPVLTASLEGADTRRRLETLLAEERRAGLQPEEAREKLVKEAAFTWLNRFVAFKMLEARKLLRQTITRGQDSNGFKMWLTEPGSEAHLADYERGDLPQDGLGEGPRQRAYRRFLLAQCAKLSREVRVLFDPDSLPSRFCPRPKALRSFIDMLNVEELTEAWQPGNEETIGWVYQGFNSEELEKAFREVRVSKKKFEAKDIPAVTQLFTPRWIVRFLVENTLGRMWINMHPDSQLATSLEYLVPLQNRRETGLKSVRDIRLLDPACGTMHFGLVAFELFVEMYREEMAHAGEPGWPETPPVGSEEEIPATIIARNIHGIDIDLRAVQLSALTLYLKAKTVNPDANLTESRLASADIHMLDGDRLGQFLEQTDLKSRPIYGRVLRALQGRLKDSEQLGSLLRLEQEITSLIEQERERFEREGRQPDLYGWSKVQFESEAGREEFWKVLEDQIIQELHDFAYDQADRGYDHSFFTGETAKGLRLLELMAQRYDVVVTNPPYMSARKMNAKLKKLIAGAYSAAKGDLYAAFIQRCIEFAGETGRVGMLTMHSFMFITSYERLRSGIRDHLRIETLVHTGPALFAVGNPGTLQTAAYVLCREEDEKTRNDSVGTYFRLVKEPDSEAKQRRFEQAIDNLCAGRDDPIVYRYRQGDFDAIPGSPWVYWITPGLRRVFETFPRLEEIAQPRQGLATADNFRFLRYWWEPGIDQIGFGCRNTAEAQETGQRWFPYMKGGSYKKWYGNQSFCIKYGNNGYELKAWADPLYGNSGWSRIIKSVDHYFRRGVTYNAVTSGGFSARYMPEGFPFDHAGNCLFPEKYEAILELLGLLNSSFSNLVLKLVNPTINFYVGDLARLPIPDASSDKLRSLVEQAISLAKAASEEDETTWDFIAPPDWPDGIQKVAERHARLAEIEREIDEEVYRLYGISDEDRHAIERELAEAGSLSYKQEEQREQEDGVT